MDMVQDIMWTLANLSAYFPNASLLMIRLNVPRLCLGFLRTTEDTTVECILRLLANLVADDSAAAGDLLSHKLMNTLSNRIMTSWATSEAIPVEAASLLYNIALSRPDGLGEEIHGIHKVLRVASTVAP
jgi:hypothetical protein